MADKDLMRNIGESLLELGVINAGGYAFKFVDPAINKVNFFSSNVSTNTSAKWKKALLYSSLGLIADVAIEEVADGNEIGEYIAEGVGDFLYGLSAGTIAADPVVQSFPPQYKAVNSGGAAASVIQKSVPTGNVFS